MDHDAEDQEELSEEASGAIATSREYFRQGGEGISFEQVVADCGVATEPTQGSQKNL